MRLRQTLIGLVTAGLTLFVGGCASLTSSSVDAFMVSNADFADRDLHEQLRHAILSGKSPRFDQEEFAVQGHQINEGVGSVLVLREQALGSILKTDQSSFWNLTLHFHQALADLADDATLEIDADVLAFWSTGAINAPGSNGCVGYGRGGRVKLERNSQSATRVIIDITVDAISPLGWPDECQREVRITRQVLAKFTTLSEFLGWEESTGVAQPRTTLTPPASP